MYNSCPGFISTATDTCLIASWNRVIAFAAGVLNASTMSG
jgi:hypothetical protein